MNISRRKFFFFLAGAIFFLEKKWSFGACCSAEKTFLATSTLTEVGSSNNQKANFLNFIQQKNLEMFIHVVVPHQGEAFDRAKKITFDRIIQSFSQGPPPFEQNQFKAYLDHLQNSAQDQYKRDFYQLSLSESTLLVKKTEQQQVFQDLLNQVLAHFYNDRGVWTALGYPGPSMNENGKYLGGYVNKGFDELGW
ncbi:gluconate 2-dehydrogenase subunit 3 family protein [Candidatus Methylacidiphilum infernorum]|uniref:Gluconate 2-dehydrogenase subunit 3 family protein n=1 Tax=Candidatus Methylacidiphilum infernorum TaxID=511746 RepID=A0ABX7PX72_9BACT|nr:gluconate 2-dehydrogenase subunit 3 family protein [Candidatus Methylacidiphilum infernorum]QSR87161.1 gluconate 2-dehydrogenase subunit 3 family protein [Candidatus Methylacidiphilum infernorum]